MISVFQADAWTEFFESFPTRKATSLRRRTAYPPALPAVVATSAAAQPVGCNSVHVTSGDVAQW